MMRFRYIAVFTLCMVGGWVTAQQLPQFTQYQWTGLSFNPAFAGKDSSFNVFGTHRSQWVGVNDAPRTYFMGLHAPSANGKMGFGGTIYTDVAGPTRRFGVMGTYAYHLQISAHTRLSLGVAFGLTQFSIDGSQITLREEGDQALTGGIMSEIKPDASFGAVYYGKRWYVGVSANQILNNNLDLFPGDGDSRLTVHYYLTGGYEFTLSDKFVLIPSILAKYANPLTPQVDVSARLQYQGNLWLGGSYRSNDAAAVFVGYRIMDYLGIGYSFDFTTSDMRNYSDGTHEILIHLQFGRN